MSVRGCLTTSTSDKFEYFNCIYASEYNHGLEKLDTLTAIDFHYLCLVVPAWSIQPKENATISLVGYF